MNRILAGVGLKGQGVSDLDFFRILDPRNDVPDIPCGQIGFGGQIHAQDPNFVCTVFLARGHEFHAVAFLEASVQNAVVCDDAPKGVEDGVEHHGLQWGFRVALGGRHPIDNGLEDGLHAHPCFPACRKNVVHLATDQIHNLLSDHFGVRGVQIHFVQHRHNFQIVLQRQVKVADGLGLDALGGVDDEQGPLAGRDGTRHFIAEIDVPRGVDQIEDVFLTVFALVGHLNGVALDGDAPLSLQIHVIQGLLLQLTVGNRPGRLEQTVGQGALSVVDVCDDAKVADVLHICQVLGIPRQIVSFTAPDAPTKVLRESCAPDFVIFTRPTCNVCTCSMRSSLNTTIH